MAEGLNSGCPRRPLTADDLARERVTALSMLCHRLLVLACLEKSKKTTVWTKLCSRRFPPQSLCEATVSPHKMSTAMRDSNASFLILIQTHWYCFAEPPPVPVLSSESCTCHCWTSFLAKVVSHGCVLLQRWQQGSATSLGKDVKAEQPVWVFSLPVSCFRSPQLFLSLWY